MRKVGKGWGKPNQRRQMKPPNGRNAIGASERSQHPDCAARRTCHLSLGRSLMDTWMGALPPANLRADVSKALQLLGLPPSAGVNSGAGTIILR